MTSSNHIGLTGRWRGILVEEGIDDACLTGKQAPCPICGGKDRFRFDDKDEGMWFCNHCGSGDGFSLLMGKYGYDFREAIARAKKAAGVVEHDVARKEPSDALKLSRLKSTWEGADPADPALVEYLQSRGILLDAKDNHVLRWHPSLLTDSARAPAMLARYFNWGENEKMVSCTIQRIWPSLKTKKVMPSPVKMSGVFCPLGGMPDEILGVAEGVETAMSYREMNLIKGLPYFPVWATYSAEQLQRFVPPSCVKQLHILIDIDYSYTGQAACYTLAKKLRETHPDLDTHVVWPVRQDDNANWDFNDELMRRLSL